MKTNIKLLIADDHNLFRNGIIKLLKEHQQIIVVGEAADGEETISKYFELSPDIILIDIAMPGMTGPAAVDKISEKDPKVKALFLSMYEGEEYVYRVLKSGGSGLINKSILEEELIVAIEIVCNGEKYFKGFWDETSLQNLIVEFESGKKFTVEPQEIKLNYREEQIFKFLYQGLNSSEMADKLNLSKKTIDYYRSCLMKKFNLKSSADLIRFALQHNPLEGDLPKYS
jgi:two-component system, NarL family, invasion response regulator UvrY